MSTHSRHVAIAALFVASCLASALLAEFGFRLYAIGWNALSYKGTRSIVPLGQAGVTRASPFLAVGYELKPGLDVLYKLAPLRTNADGLHDIDYPRMKPPGHFRVAVIGDSQTMASGVPLEQTYHALLEDRFNDRGQDVRFDFINFAVGGYDPGHYVAVLEHRALAYDPDLVLVGFTPGNDHKWAKKRYVFREKPRRNGFFTSLIVFKVQSLLRAWREGNPRNDRAALTPEQKQRIDRVFADMKALAESRGIPVAIAYLARVEGERTADVREIMEGQGFTFIDTTPAFRDVPLADTQIFRTDRHPNAFAHERFADAIEPALRTLVAAAR